MRTTLTLDDDVARKLTAEMRRSGRPFKEIVNACLRMALNAKRQAPPAVPFVVRSRPLDPAPGISFDNTEALLDQLEGPTRR
jgi:hypothetical protein